MPSWLPVTAAQPRIFTPVHSRVTPFQPGPRRRNDSRIVIVWTGARFFMTCHKACNLNPYYSCSNDYIDFFGEIVVFQYYLRNFVGGGIEHSKFKDHRGLVYPYGFLMGQV